MHFHIALIYVLFIKRKAPSVKRLPAETAKISLTKTQWYDVLACIIQK